MVEGTTRVVYVREVGIVGIWETCEADQKRQIYRWKVGRYMGRVGWRLIQRVTHYRGGRRAFIFALKMKEERSGPWG